MKHALLALTLLVTACASSQDYLAACNNDTGCAERLSNEENTRRAGAAALGFGALLLGVAAGLAAAAPAPVYYVPVRCNAWGCW